MNRTVGRWTWVLGSAVGLCGCEPRSFPDQLPISLVDVTAIRSDADLSSAEKRAELARLGLDDETINALLAGDRTGNQFGGDLRTAWEKVTGGRLNELTPDELQIYTDAAGEEDTTITFELTDVQAAAAVRFLVEGQIATTDALSNVLDDATKEIPPQIPEDFLQRVLLDFDPDLLIDNLP